MPFGDSQPLWLRELEADPTSMGALRQRIATLLHDPVVADAVRGAVRMRQAQVAPPAPGPTAAEAGAEILHDMLDGWRAFVAGEGGGLALGDMSDGAQRLYARARLYCGAFHAASPLLRRLCPC